MLVLMTAVSLKVHNNKECLQHLCYRLLLENCMYQILLVVCFTWPN